MMIPFKQLHLQGINKNKKLYFWWPVIYAVAAGYMFVILKIHAAGDFFAHVDILMRFLSHNSFPVPPGYPFTIWLLSGFQSGTYILLAASTVALAAFITFKIWVICHYLESLLKNTQEIRRYTLFISVCLAIAAPVYTFSGFFYLGTVAFNIWHSPTYMTMIPFAILLFMHTPLFLEHPRRHLPVILLLAVLNLLIKPSFLFAWIPGVFLYALIYRYRNFRALALIAFTLFIIGVMILLQYYMIYVREEFDLIVQQDPATSGVAIDFFEVWRFFLGITGTPFLISIISSFLFPIAFLLLYGISGHMSDYTRLALFITVIGMFFALLVVETGDRFQHGNFFWTAFSGNMMLFLATVLNTLKIYTDTRKINLKLGILSIIFLLHLLSGIGYLSYFAMTGQFI